jgi:hypothetical protein
MILDLRFWILDWRQKLTDKKLSTPFSVSHFDIRQSKTCRLDIL